jgi:hypothetical protein
LYIDEGSVSRASKKVGMTHKTFVKSLKFHGIPVLGRQSKYLELRDKEWLKRRYIDEKKSVGQIALEIGATVGAVHSAIRWLGIELRKTRVGLSIRFPEGRFGKDSPKWKGGIRHTTAGYVYIYMPDHLNSTSEGYIMEHRLVMEKHVGRYLKKEELVHHVNGIKDDNRIENLELVSDQGTHTREHFERSHITEITQIEMERLRQLLLENGINPDQNIVVDK